MTFPPECPVFVDGIPGMCDWLVGLNVGAGFILTGRFMGSFGRARFYCSYDQEQYFGAELNHLRPLTRAAREMMAIARGGR